MTLLPLLWGLEHDRKRVSEHNFQTSECDTSRTECGLNHPLECQTRSVTKSKVKRAYLEGNL